MSDPVFCPSCGEEMNAWYGSICECPDCGAMLDIDELEEEED